MRVLRSIAFITHGEDYPVATMAAHVLEEALLGRGHALTVVADRIAAAGIGGTQRD